MAARSRNNGTNLHWLRKSCDIRPCDSSPDGNTEKYGRPMKSAVLLGRILYMEYSFGHLYGKN